MTQNEKTAYDNGFVIGLATGINARKTPRKYIFTSEQVDDITGDTSFLRAESSISIAVINGNVTGDTQFNIVKPHVSIGNTLFLEVL